jgi:hypothetical protein
MNTIVRALLVAVAVVAIASVSGTPAIRVSATGTNFDCCDNPPPTCPPICSDPSTTVGQ